MFGRPIFISRTFLDIPLTADDLAPIAALAPPEPVRQKRAPKHSRLSKHQIIDRARAYVAKADPAISGQHGSDQTMDVACVLILGFDLAIEDALPILQEWNDRNDEKWTEHELLHKLKGADERGGDRGYLLTESASLQFPPREITTLDTSLNSFEPMEHVVQSEVIVLPSCDDSPLVDQENPIASFGFQDMETSTTEVTVAPEPKPLRTVPMNWDSPRVQEGRTDIANGSRLARIIYKRARYVESWDSWVIWDGKRWKVDNLGIREFAKEIPGTILADAMAEPPIDPYACKWAIESSSRPRIEAAISMCKSIQGVNISHEELDADPWLLNCQNGIVDLRTGQLSPHDPTKMITRITNVEYDPDAETYEWDRFLEKILIDDSLIRHVQRLIGYCCTGSTREQVLPIFWGEGSNGKSTMLDTLKAALGTDYASTAPPSLIVQKKSESHPTELAGLCGKRMVTAIETEKGQRLNEPLVKQLTGSDSISARRMRENFWEFKPTHKIILCTNHEPRVGDDYAIWRRLVMIPFTVQFWNPEKGETGPVELQRDNDLPARLEKCLPGVLAWAVRGAIDWFNGGLSVDEKTRQATAEYRERQDYFGRFVAERCVTGPVYRVQFSKLYDQYKDWAEENGERVASKKSFGEWLNQKRFEKDKSNGIWIIGLSWKAEYDKSSSFEQF